MIHPLYNLLRDIKKIKEDGFTLIEVLISISLYGILITMVLSSMNFNINTISKIGKSVEIQQQAQFIFNFMEEKIMESTGLTYLEDKQFKSKYYSNDKVFINKMIFKNKPDRTDKGYIFQLIKDPEYDYYNLKFGIGLSGEATVEVGNYIESIEVEPLPSDKKYNKANGIVIRINFLFDGYRAEAESAFYFRNFSGGIGFE